MQALQKCRHYLLGCHFYIQIDHCSLKHLLEQCTLTNSKQRLMIKLLRLISPLCVSLERKILQLIPCLEGHGGYLKTLKWLSAQLHWHVLCTDVSLVNRTSTKLWLAGLLQPLPIMEQIWEEISMDFITRLPKSKGYDTILFTVDRLSKYSHLIPLSHPFIAKFVAALFCKEIVRLHGMPRSITADCDSIFLSAFWQELFCLSQSCLNTSTTYNHNLMAKPRW